MFCCEACSIHCVSESLAVEVKVFFLSLKQHVSGPYAFDKENGPERLKSKGLMKRTQHLLLRKKSKPCDF